MVCAHGHVTHVITPHNYHLNSGRKMYYAVACDACATVCSEVTRNHGYPVYVVEFYDPEKHTPDTVALIRLDGE